MIFDPGEIETLLDKEPIENIATKCIDLALGKSKGLLDLALNEDSEDLSCPPNYCEKNQSYTETIEDLIENGKVLEIDPYTYNEYELPCTER